MTVAVTQIVTNVTAGIPLVELLSSKKYKIISTGQEVGYGQWRCGSCN